MGEVVWWLILGSLLVRSESAPAWGSSCSSQCACHLSYFADLPLHYWLNGNSGNKVTTNKEHHNEVFYEDNEPQKQPGISVQPNTLLKMAMCIFQDGISHSILLEQLPSDTQVLSLLQGRNTSEIILEPQDILSFRDLIYLDVQGYNQDADNISNKLILSSDVFKSLVSLQYLNLQHIKLMSEGEKDNKIHTMNSPNKFVDPVSNEISINLQDNIMKRSNKPSRDDLQNLIFLTPPGSDSEVVPYTTYLERKEQRGQRTFAGLSNLEFLRVFGCDLHEISWEMFEGLNKLIFLSLEQNHLLFIPEFAFYGTPNLQILSLSHNKLLNLQSTSLAGLLKLENLDLSHNKFSHLSEFSLPPFPKLKTANFKHNPIEAIFASTFEIMNATTTLYIGGNSSLLDIHPNSFLGLHSLRKLNIENISITLLERQLLSGMPLLAELEIFGTITALSFDAFVEVPKLEKLNLKNCKIESVSMDAFYGLYALQVLDLSNNLLQTLPPGVFDQQFSLKELFLQNNLLTELPIGLFKNLPAKIVRLEGNSWHCSCGMKEWPSSVINRAKHTKSKLCQKEYDKGSTCSHSTEDIYVYDKRVTPLCATPKKYKGWSIFQVLRKELRCTKKLRNKLNKNFYLRKKYEDYEKLVKTNYHDKDRKEYLEHIQGTSKHENGTSTSEQNKTKTDQPTANSNQINDSSMLQAQPTTELPLSNITSISSIPTQIKEKINITIETNFNTAQDSASQEINDLNPLAGGNDFLAYQHHEVSNKGKDFNNLITDIHKPTYYKTNFENMKQQEILENSNMNFKEQLDAKTLKKLWKLEMEKNHQKKLQKYYS